MTITITGAAAMPPLLFLDVNIHQLTDNLSINFLMINTKAYSPFGYSLWSCSSKACSGKKEGIRKELFLPLYIIKTMFTFAENFIIIK